MKQSINQIRVESTRDPRITNCHFTHSNAHNTMVCQLTGPNGDLFHGEADGYSAAAEMVAYEKAEAAFLEKYPPEAKDEVSERGFNFGRAMELIKEGKRVARAGWNGKDMWIAYSPGAKELYAANFWSPANQAWAKTQPNGCAEVLSCVTMKTADNKILMGWLASQTDMLSTDWQEVA